MSTTDDLIANNESFAAVFDHAGLPMPPGKKVVVLACMDAASQHLLGTEEVILVHHTDCGMLTFTDEQLEKKLEDATGERPDWSAQSFADVAADTRASIERLRESPFIPHKKVRGFVYDVETGQLEEVTG